MPESFKKTYDRLNAAQKLVVDTIDGPVLVIAGPGTGKTQLLTTRVANILDKTDSLAANILCLTFTDSAAAAMRERLTSIIGRAAYDVTISTYHAFGSELIRRYPEYFTNSADLKPVDNLTIDTILRSILLNLPYSNPLRHDLYLRDIKQFISDSKRALLTPKVIRQVALANEQFLAKASKAVQKHLSNLKCLDKSAAPLFMSLAADSVKTDNRPIAPNVLNLQVLWQQSLEAAIDHFESTGKSTELTKWKNSWLAKDDSAEFIAAGSNQVKRLKALSIIYELYLSELKSLSLFDYDDMILSAIKGLEGHPDLRYTLQEQYLYILLDEYQDTNEAQARLVALLTDNPVNEGRPNVMAVGDDDQAIYAFQGANYSHMLSFYKHYRETLVVPLTANYRSHADILTLASGVANQIESRLQNQLPLIDKQLEAKAQGLPARATVERLEFRSDLSQNTWVAKQIAKLISKGMPASQIAVLAPKHEYLEALVPFLHQAGLPVHYEKRENVLDDPVVRELVTMSRLALAIGNNNQSQADSLWPEILSYSFWGLATEELWNLSWQAADNHTPWTDVLLSEAKLKSIAVFFIRLAQLARSESMEQLLDYQIGTEQLKLSPTETWRSPFYEHYFGALLNQTGPTADLWQLLSNLTVVREHLREYKPGINQALKLTDFVEFVDAHLAANIKILNTNPHQEALEAVELMTAYKAKGQEFAAVFLLACNDEIWGSKARNQSSRLSLPENLSFIRYSSVGDDERLRLLYVALTRAKTNLYLTSYSSSYTGKRTTRLKYLDEQIDGKGEVISPLLADSQQKVKLIDTEPPKIDALTVYWQNRHYEAMEQPKLQALLASRLERFQLSATELNCFTDVTNDGPASFFTRFMLRFPVASTPASLYGSAVHETLEWLPQYLKEHAKLPTASRTIQFFEKRMDFKRLNEPQATLLKQRGRDSLTVYLSQCGGTIKASYLTEYNFRNEAVFINKAHMSGKIDKLMIDRKNKTITIVDYKTGKSFARWAREVKMHAFRQQLYCYKLLVEHSRSFKGYKVDDAYLEFVEPDDDGKIRELHIDFEDEQLKRTEQLIEVVWRLIQDLKLPDISGYSKDLKGLEQFEQDLIDGKF